jgi:hypothetical protein
MIKRLIGSATTLFVALTLSTIMTAPAAHADSSDTKTAPVYGGVGTFDNSTPGLYKEPAPDSDVVITATVTGSAIAKATAKSLSEATGSSYAFAVAWGHSNAKIDPSQCKWSTGINTYWSGGVFHMGQDAYDPVPSHICKLVHPVVQSGHTFYWKKIGGGTSGSACGNLFIPSHQNVSYTQVVWLDVKAGTIAKVAVKSRVCVEVTVEVNVTLEYTYNGETHQITKTETATDHACKTVKDHASKRITKHTTRRASAKSVAKAKAMVRTKATARATARATVKAKAKAVAQVSVTITIHQPSAPSVSASANGCIGPNHPTATVNVSFASSNDEDTSATVTFDSQQPKQVPLTNGQGSTTFTVTSTGSYSGKVTVNPSGMVATYSVNVPPCPTPVDTPPSMECQVPQHIFVGDDAMYADFDTVDPDGDAISYGQPVISGPINVVMVERSTVNGKEHLSVKFVAQDGVVPDGSSQTATISVTATAGGKTATCSGTVTVENNRTGW